VAQVNDFRQGSERYYPAMGQLAGCATFGRYLVLALLGGLALAVLYFSRPSGLGTVVPQDGGTTSARPTPGGIPAVSNRHFTSGQADGVAVGAGAGAVNLKLSLQIDTDKAYAQDGLAWIAFEQPPDTDAILISLDEPEDSVAISRGGKTALGVGGQCQFNITVTGDKVSGTIHCLEADALSDGAKVGHVSIDVSFWAKS